METRRATKRLKARLVPSRGGEWFLAAFVLVVVLCAWTYSARDDLYKTYLGLQPSPGGGEKGLRRGPEARADEDRDRHEGRRFRLEIPLVEEALVPPEEQRLPPEPFPGTPFVFVFEITVRPDSVVEAGQKETPTGTTLTPERVTDSSIRGLFANVIAGRAVYKGAYRLGPRARAS